MTDEQNPNLPPDEDENASTPEGDVSESADVEASGGEMEADESAGQMESEESADAVAAAVDDGAGDESAGDEFKVVNEDDVSEDDAEAAMLRMLEDLPQDEEKAGVGDIDFGTAEVSKAEFQHLQAPAGSKGAQNIDLLMDVDLPVSIELGRTKLSIAEILALGPGSVVELNKLAGEPVDLLVNNKPVAKGEVVVVDENFGLRITQLMTPEERLKSLGKE